MVNNDLFHALTPVLETNRAAVTATGNDIIDTLGFSYILFLLEISAVAAGDASNKLAFTIEESDDATFGDGSEVAITGSVRLHCDDATADLANGTLFEMNNTNLANTLKTFGVQVGTKRYLRLVWTETGTASATFSVIALKGGARHE